MSEWRSIETAPIREAVIIHHPGYWTRLGCLHEDGTWWTWPGPAVSDLIPYKPTHWARIPDEP